MAKTSHDDFIQSAEYEPERFFVPSSLLSINDAIDNPRGFQSGRMLELVGTESTGKSTLALDLIANAQKLFPDNDCVYVDVERSFDAKYARLIGIDNSQLKIVRADSAESSLETAEIMCRRGARIVVIDSVSFLVPRSHNEYDAEDTDVEIDYEKSKKIAALGTILGDWVKRMVSVIDYHNTLLIFINQYRSNFSTMTRVEKKPYGPFAYRHALTWRLELARVSNEDKRTTVHAKCTKNRLGAERGMAKYDIIYGKGLDIKGDLLKHAVEVGIVTKSGAWYYYDKDLPTQVRVQGLENATELFDYDLIRKRLYELNMV